MLISAFQCFLLLNFLLVISFNVVLGGDVGGVTLKSSEAEAVAVEADSSIDVAEKEDEGVVADASDTETTETTEDADEATKEAEAEETVNEETETTDKTATDDVAKPASSGFCSSLKSMIKNQVDIFVAMINSFIAQIQALLQKLMSVFKK